MTTGITRFLMAHLGTRHGYMNTQRWKQGRKQYSKYRVQSCLSRHCYFIINSPSAMLLLFIYNSKYWKILINDGVMRLYWNWIAKNWEYCLEYSLPCSPAIQLGPGDIEWGIGRAIVELSILVLPPLLFPLATSEARRDRAAECNKI